MKKPDVTITSAFIGFAIASIFIVSCSNISSNDEDMPLTNAEKTEHVESEEWERFENVAKAHAEALQDADTPQSQNDIRTEIMAATGDDTPDPNGEALLVKLDDMRDAMVDLETGKGDQVDCTDENEKSSKPCASYKSAMSNLLGKD